MRYLLVLIVGIAFMMDSCATPPQVAQGTVVSWDETNKTVAIGDREKPGSTVEFRFEGAEVGLTPRPGDTIRIAYQTQNGSLKATRIMNISRQKELRTGK